MLDCFKAQERVNGPKEQEDKTLRIKDTSGLHLYRVRPSHSFRGGGRGGVFDLKNQGLGFAPGGKKPCYRKSNSS